MLASFITFWLAKLCFVTFWHIYGIWPIFQGAGPILRHAALKGTLFTIVKNHGSEVLSCVLESYTFCAVTRQNET